MKNFFNEIPELLAKEFIKYIFIAVLGGAALLGLALLPAARAFLFSDFPIKTGLFLPLQIFNVFLIFIVIRNAKVIRRLREKLLVDELTGIYSSRALAPKFEEMHRICRKGGKKLSVILFDINDFRSINHDYGHMDANIILRRLVRLVHEEIRQTDIFIRMHDSGDEFIILAYNASATGAESVAERFREKIRKYQKFSGRDNPVPKAITISAGVAEFSFDGDTLDSVLRRADEALKTAKEKKDFVCVDWSYESPIETSSDNSGRKSPA